MANLLVVENELPLLKLLGTLLKREQHEVTTASSGEEAQTILEKQPFDLLLTDISMDGINGIELLRWARQRNPSLSAIIFTGCGDVSTAMEALKLGAFDYLSKPFRIDELLYTVRRALEYNRALQENMLLKAQLETSFNVGDLVVVSASMQKVSEMIRRMGPTDASLLIIGEVGTGKETVARAIHAASSRKDSLFLAVNCAALTGPQLESELFGHLKGAIPGAEAHKEGLFEAAKGGTLFLDEIGAMPLETQEKLLHVLQDREVRRLSSNQGIPINVRVLAATSDDLPARIRKGLFREDLFNRLGAISIEIAPLRKRPEDILPIADSLLRKASAAGEKTPRLSRETCSILESYEWPGNVRELDDCIKHVLSLGPREEIGPDDLPPQIRAAAPKPPVSGPASVSIPGLEHAVSLKAFLHRKEKEYLEQALKRVDGDKKAAAQNLNISVADLQRKLSDSKEG